MKRRKPTRGEFGTRPGPSRIVSVALAVVATAAACATADPPNESTVPTERAATTVSQPPPATVVGPEGELAERWGVEVVALRNTAAGYMLDFRYRVLDPDKAAPLFDRANKPVVIHHETGARMEVHNPAKTGPLRPTNPPEAGRIYFIMFSNAGGVVRPGDLATVEIGEFSADVIAE